MPPKLATPATLTKRVRSSALILLATLIVLRPGILLGEGRELWETVMEHVARWRAAKDEAQKERRRRDLMTPL